MVENIGIERTFQKMEEAKIVIWLLDEQPSASEIEEMKQKNQGKKLLVVFNKMDKMKGEKRENDKFTHFFGSDSSRTDSSSRSEVIFNNFSRRRESSLLK